MMQELSSPCCKPRMGTARHWHATQSVFVFGAQVEAQLAEEALQQQEQGLGSSSQTQLGQSLEAAGSAAADEVATPASSSSHPAVAAEPGAEAGGDAAQDAAAVGDAAVGDAAADGEASCPVGTDDVVYDTEWSEEQNAAFAGSEEDDEVRTQHCKSQHAE